MRGGAGDALRAAAAKERVARPAAERAICCFADDAYEIFPADFRRCCYVACLFRRATPCRFCAAAAARCRALMSVLAAALDAYVFIIVAFTPRRRCAERHLRFCCLVFILLRLPLIFRLRHTPHADMFLTRRLLTLRHAAMLMLPPLFSRHCRHRYAAFSAIIFFRRLLAEAAA